MIDEAKRWYLPKHASRRGLKQADMVRELGLGKNSGHKLWYGKQAMTYEQMAAIASWAGLEIHELFMPPEEVEALAQLRATARIIAGELGSS